MYAMPLPWCAAVQPVNVDVSIESLACVDEPTCLLMVTIVEPPLGPNVVEPAPTAPPVALPEPMCAF